MFFRLPSSNRFEPNHRRYSLVDCWVPRPSDLSSSSCCRMRIRGRREFEEMNLKDQKEESPELLAVVNTVLIDERVRRDVSDEER